MLSLASFTKRSLFLGVSALCLVAGGSLLAGCNPPHTPDAVVGNQGTKDPGETGAVLDSSGKVVSNPSTGAGDRKGLGN
jgi:hypothetical protein